MRLVITDIATGKEIDSKYVWLDATECLPLYWANNANPPTVTSIFQCLCSMSISGAKTAHEKSTLFARPPTARQFPPQHHMHISARAPSQPMDKAAFLRAGTRLTLRHRMGATPRIISLSLTTHKVTKASSHVFHEIVKADQYRL